MIEAPILKNEKERLAALEHLKILDTPPEERFDRITRIAIKFFNAPISTITLVDSKREWYKSCQGLSNREAPRAISFCGHTISSYDALIIPDALKDKRFQDNPMVLGSPFIRFYAGVSLLSTDRQRIGVFCIKDTKPRDFGSENTKALKDFAAWVEVELNNHELSQALEANRKFATELAESKNWFYATLSSLGDAVIVINDEKNIVLINDVAQALTGWKADEAAGQDLSKVFNIINEETGKSVLDFLVKLSPSTNKIVGMANHTILIAKNGKRIFIEDSAALIYGASMGGIVIVFRDITARREEEIKLLHRTEELEKLNKFMIGRELEIVKLKEEINKLKQQR